MPADHRVVTPYTGTYTVNKVSKRAILVLIRLIVEKEHKYQQQSSAFASADFSNSLVQ